MRGTPIPVAAVTPDTGPIIARLTAADLAAYAQKQAEQVRYLSREFDSSAAAEWAAAQLDMIAGMLCRDEEA